MATPLYILRCEVDTPPRGGVSIAPCGKLVDLCNHRNQQNTAEVTSKAGSQEIIVLPPGSLTLSLRTLTLGTRPPHCEETGTHGEALWRCAGQQSHLSTQPAASINHQTCDWANPEMVPSPRLWAFQLGPRYYEAETSCLHYAFWESLIQRIREHYKLLFQSHQGPGYFSMQP